MSETGKPHQLHIKNLPDDLYHAWRVALAKTRQTGRAWLIAQMKAFVREQGNGVQKHG